MKKPPSLSGSLLRPHPARRTRGSGIVVALIFTAVLSAMLASMLKWVMLEASINKRSLYLLEARNAAESLAEYGMTQVRYKMENTAVFVANSFTPAGPNALVLPASSLFTGTRVDNAQSAVFAGKIANVVTSPSASLYYIDPVDPNNTYDPLKAKWVFRRDIPIFAKVKVTPASGPPIYAYVREKISVRGAPLFAHSIFYNMDLELSPGGTMNIYGPIHANGHLYVSAQSNGSSILNFRNVTTCTGNLYHAWKDFQPTAHGQTNGVTGDDLGLIEPVTFINRLGTQVSMLNSGTWKDSTMGVSTTVNANNEAGNYSTQADYLAALTAGATTNLTAFRLHSSTTWNGNVQTAANGVQNYTPVSVARYVEDTTPTDGTDQSVNTGHLLIEPPATLPASGPNNVYSAEVEAQKYSTQAGIYIKIVPASGYTNTTTTSGATTTVTTNDPTVPATITVRTGGPAGTVATSVPAGLVTYRPYKQIASTTSGTTTYAVTANRGMFDQRRGHGVDLVELDLAKLKLAVAEMQVASGSRDATKAINSLETSHWTGVVYVEVVGNPTTQFTDGATIAAASGDKVGVRLINGNAPVASYGTNEGLTIATNAPLYIKGHFNDDGSGTLNASVSRSGETPAAIAADAVTLLSAGYDDTTSRSTVRPNASGNTVVAAAILTGISPTNKDGSARSSGGAHNLVRYLENWRPGTVYSVYIRGSLVALFESRIATEPWKINYYNAPDRNYGFSDILQNGRFPPGTPRVISYRRTEYTDITATEYNAGLTAANAP